MMKSGVVTLSNQKSGEFSIYRMGLSHRLPPMRLWPFSYWPERAMPLPQRMSPYVLVMFTTGAPAIAAANICVCVIM